MKRFVDWLVRRWIPNYECVDDPAVRMRYGSLEAVGSIVCNCLLFGVKLFLSWMLGSVALLTDAIHSLSDSGTSVMVLIGFRAACKPGDREHPFGHGRAEAITALIIAVLLMVTGIELIHSAVDRILEPSIAVESLPLGAILILVGTIVIKELTARISFHLGRAIDSPALYADAWHHRSDAISTVLVMGALVLSGWKVPLADGIAGVVVALFIMYSGYVVARDAINPLLGERPSKKLLYQIEDLARSVEGVLGVHDVIVHRYGQLLLISLHVEVDEEQSVQSVHEISEDVEAAIEDTLGGSSVVVHMDPLQTGHKLYGKLLHLLTQLSKQHSCIEGFHDLRLAGPGDPLDIHFDITPSAQAKDDQVQKATADLRSRIGRLFPNASVHIKVEPPFAYTRPNVLR